MVRLILKKKYLYKIEDFEFLPGVISALKMLQEAGYFLIIITNQSGIARGYYTEEDYSILNDWMIKELKKQGINITAVYYCPHHPRAKIEKYKKDCDCRKPKLGMYEQAVEDFGLNLDDCFAIGDNPRDCAICKSTACRGYLIVTNDKEEKIEAVKSKKYNRVKCAADLYAAATDILATSTSWFDA